MESQLESETSKEQKTMFWGKTDKFLLSAQENSSNCLEEKVYEKMAGWIS